MTSAEYTVSSQPQNNSEPSWPPQMELTLKYIGKSRFECAAMYLIEKSLTANRYPRQRIAVVMHTKAASAALRPLAIKLSCFRRIPISEAMIEYAVTTNARAKANWPSCAMFSRSFLCRRRILSHIWRHTWLASCWRRIHRHGQAGPRPRLVPGRRTYLEGHRCRRTLRGEFRRSSSSRFAG